MKLTIGCFEPSEAKRAQGDQLNSDGRKGHLLCFLDRGPQMPPSPLHITPFRKTHDITFLRDVQVSSNPYIWQCKGIEPNGQKGNQTNVGGGEKCRLLGSR